MHFCKLFVSILNALQIPRSLRMICPLSICSRIVQLRFKSKFYSLVASPLSSDQERYRLARSKIPALQRDTLKKINPCTLTVHVTTVLSRQRTRTRIFLDIRKLQRRFCEIREGICRGEKQTMVAVFPAVSLSWLEARERTRIPSGLASERERFQIRKRRKSSKSLGKTPLLGR